MVMYIKSNGGIMKHYRTFLDAYDAVLNDSYFYLDKVSVGDKTYTMMDIERSLLCRLKRSIIRSCVKPGDTVLARVARAGSAKPGANGWAYSTYIADAKCKSGYKFISTGLTLWPKKSDYHTSYLREINAIYNGQPIVDGRPNQITNAPWVIA